MQEIDNLVDGIKTYRKLRRQFRKELSVGLDVYGTDLYDEMVDAGNQIKIAIKRIIVG